jgi:rod shape-determining protein MreC
VQDKYVRRRRAVLAALVAASLILLTAYFGEAENSPLHSIQQGIVEVFTPVQEGASKVLSPVRDLTSWISSTLHAKSQNTELRERNALLNKELGQDGTALADYNQLAATVKLSDRIKLNQYGPVYANVITHNPQVWYETIEIDKGSGAGIAYGDPVLSDGGLVGEVSSVGSDFAVVSGLSAPKFAAYSKIIDASGNGGLGTLSPTVGDPTKLQINYVPATSTITGGDQVVTAGYRLPGSAKNNSLFPPGIPIGVVSDFNENQLVDNETVNVSPDVDLRNVSQVEILTKVRG